MTLHRPDRVRTRLVGLALALVAGVSGCASAAAPDRGSTTSLGPQSTPTRTTPTATPTAEADERALEPAGNLVPVVEKLDAPWSITVLDDDSILLSFRDTAEFGEIVDGRSRVIGSFADAEPAGEGGLLGITVATEGEREYLYAYATTATDNRVVRMPLKGRAGERTLGPPEEILTGIPQASNHDGGRIKVGPDGMLYVTTGDAGDTSAAQDPASLGGKILRVTLAGGVPEDNPVPGSPVWSMGHRNPQGIAWADDGTMWAAEFGQDTWDELNVIVPGGNYGWPMHEGIAGADGFVDPVQQWDTDDASPSGIAILGATVFMAALGGERLWTVGFEGEARDWFGGGELGRLRDVVVGPGDSLYLITNNTDGRGDPGARDDVLYRVPLEPAR
jgi:glucose/arabinose dehydrogenase